MVVFFFDVLAEQALASRVDIAFLLGRQVCNPASLRISQRLGHGDARERHAWARSDPRPNIALISVAVFVFDPLVDVLQPAFLESHHIFVRIRSRTFPYPRR